jgi:hypothetical protein
MTRIFTEGFEGGDLLFFDSTTGSIAITSSNPRSGIYAVAIGATAQSIAYKGIPAVSEGFARIGFRKTSNPVGSVDTFQWASGSIVLGYIRLASTGQFELIVGAPNSNVVATGTALPDATHMLLEVRIKIHDTTGVIELKADGIVNATFTGDTKPGAATTFDTLQYRNSASSISGAQIDDLAFNDTAGGADDGYCGDGKITGYVANAAGDVTQLTPSAGSNYQCVDEVPPNGDTDYVSSATPGQYDLYNIADYTPTAGSTIRRVWVESRSREESAAADTIQLGVKSGGTEYWGTARAVTTTYDQYVGNDLKVDPFDSVAWTEADIDGLQIGVKVV